MRGVDEVENPDGVILSDWSSLQMRLHQALSAGRDLRAGRLEKTNRRALSQTPVSARRKIK